MEKEAKKYITLTDDTFDQEVLRSSKPVLVDFWAPWCGPCQMMAPVIDQLAQEFDSQASIAKLNVDDHQQVAARYGIQSIPTVLIFRNGQLVDQLVGAVSKNSLAQRLSALLQAS